MNTPPHASGHALTPTFSSQRGDSLTSPHPEWMPLDGIAQTWASFGAEGSSPAAFQATGIAFLALACEASAHRHYASSVGSTGREGSPFLAYAQGLEHALADLEEAAQQWKSVLLWLDSCARDHRAHGAFPASVGQLSLLVLEQQQRVLSLLVRVQQESLDSHTSRDEPLLVCLGPLPATVGNGGDV